MIVYENDKDWQDLKIDDNKQVKTYSPVSIFFVIAEGQCSGRENRHDGRQRRFQSWRRVEMPDLQGC